MAMLATVASVLAFSPLVQRAPVAVPLRASTPAMAVDPAIAEQVPYVLGGLSVAVGVVVSTKKNKENAAEPAAAPAAAKPAAEKPKPKPKPRVVKSTWGIVPTARLKKVSSHRCQGTMPKTPTRELWTPPADWKPPTKPVSSWYDRGDRLTPPEPPAAPAAPPMTFFDKIRIALSGEEPAPASPFATGLSYGIVPSARRVCKGAHRMQGTMPKAPKREFWTPPPGWEPPSKPVTGVVSWYDSGARL